MTTPSNRRVGKPKLSSTRNSPEATADVSPEMLLSESSLERVVSASWFESVRWVLGLFVVFLTAAGAAWGGHRYITQSPRFAVTTFSVNGNQQRTEKEIIERGGLCKGVNIFSVDLNAVRAQLLADPWVGESLLLRHLPGTIEIQITERKAFAIVMLERGYLVERNGTVFKSIEPSDPSELPIVTGFSLEQWKRDRIAAERTLKQLLDLGDDWMKSGVGSRSLHEIRLAVDGNVELVVGKKEMIIAMGLPPFRRKLERAERVLAELDRRGVAAEAVWIDNDAHPERIVARVH